MDNEPFTIDVVIAARNEQRRLGETLTALQRQDYPAELVNVFVVDNGSTDRTGDVARACGRTVLSVRNGKIGAVRNAGILSGKGRLVGFLDAHCVPGATWLSMMSAEFADETIGACGGPFNYVSADNTVGSIAQARGLGSAERLRGELISGRSSSFPWLPTGNAMYRRVCLQEVGLFDESLSYCEDVDLAWKVFLRGYQFAVAPLATVTHYNEDSATLHLVKQYKLGGAVYRMSAKYEIADQKSSVPAEDPNIDINSSVQAVIARQQPDAVMPGALRKTAWTLGYLVEKLKQFLGLSAPPEPCRYAGILPQFRPMFSWSEDLKIGISNRSVYWFVDDVQCVVVRLSTPKHRYVFKDVAASIWEQLVQTASREETICALTRQYSVSSAAAANDVDEFLKVLITECLVLEFPAAGDGKP